VIDAGLVTTALAASLAGSLHCAGMCGPIVGLAALHPGPSAKGRRVRLHGTVGHALGRLVVYGAFGMVAGASGHLLDGLASTHGAMGVAARASGVGLVVAGLLGLLGWRTGAGGGLGPVARPLDRLRRAIVRRLEAGGPRAPLLAGIGLGVLSSLLPCGFLWAFVLAAAGTADPWGGALVMAAFWAGTVPVLSALGLGGDLVRRRLRGRLAAAVPALLVAVGVFILAVRVPTPSRGDDGGAPAPCHGHGG